MLSDPMLPPFIIFVCGLVVAVAPRFLIARAEAARLRRLEEIEQGAPEDYSEERRALTSYTLSRRSVRLWRILGAVAAVGSAALLLRSGLTG